MAQGCLRTEGLGFHGSAVAAHLFTAKMATMPKDWFGSVSKEVSSTHAVSSLPTRPSRVWCVWASQMQTSTSSRSTFSRCRPPSKVRVLLEHFAHASDDTVVTECVSLLNSIHEASLQNWGEPGSRSLRVH